MKNESVARSRGLALFAAVGFALLAGCAAPASQEGEDLDDQSSEVSATSRADAKLVRSLNAILNKPGNPIEVISESEFGWNILVSDAAAPAGTLTPAMVASQLGAAITKVDAKLIRAPGRKLASLRSHETSFKELFDGFEDGGEPFDAAYTATRKLLTSNLRDIKVFEFDVTAGGDQDSGPVILVVVGRSKATNKLVAMVSFEVRT